MDSRANGWKSFQPSLKVGKIQIGDREHFAFRLDCTR